MKKFLIAVLILISFCSYSFATENEDIYVRKDLFESYMKNIDLKLDSILKEQALMREDIKNIDSRLTKLETKVDGVYVALSNRIDGVEKRFDVLFNLLIAFIGLIGVIFGLPVVQRWWEERRDKKQNENIEKIFEKMFEAKMKGNLNNAI